VQRGAAGLLSHVPLVKACQAQGRGCRCESSASGATAFGCRRRLRGGGRRRHEGWPVPSLAVGCGTQDKESALGAFLQWWPVPSLAVGCGTLAGFGIRSDNETNGHTRFLSCGSWPRRLRITVALALAHSTYQRYCATGGAPGVRSITGRRLSWARFVRCASWAWGSHAVTHIKGESGAAAPHGGRARTGIVFRGIAHEFGTHHDP
jgi:hypothetical protein